MRTRLSLVVPMLLAAGAARAAGDSPGGMLEINITLVIQAANYLLFVGLMDVVLFRPMVAHLDRRRASSGEADEKAERAVEEAYRVAAEREEKLDAAYREASRERSRIKGEAVDEYQQRLHDARAEADRRIQEARDRFAVESDAAVSALDGELDDLASRIRAQLVRTDHGGQA